MLIASDFKSTALSGGACLNLDKTIYWIRQHLGPGRHYYFVDACRNVLDETQIRPGGLLLPSKPQSSEEASTYVLQSANQGGVAVADGVFSDVLVSGLRGKGSAKTWDDRYDNLRWSSGTICSGSTLQDVLKPREIYGTFAGVQGTGRRHLYDAAPGADGPPARSNLKMRLRAPAARSFASADEKRNPATHTRRRQIHRCSTRAGPVSRFVRKRRHRQRRRGAGKRRDV